MKKIEFSKDETLILKKLLLAHISQIEEKYGADSNKVVPLDALVDKLDQLRDEK